MRPMRSPCSGLRRLYDWNFTSSMIIAIIVTDHYHYDYSFELLLLLLLLVLLLLLLALFVTVIIAILLLLHALTPRFRASDAFRGAGVEENLASPSLFDIAFLM